MPDPYYRDNDDSTWDEFVEWWDSWSIFPENDNPTLTPEMVEDYNEPAHIGELFGMEDPPHKKLGKYLNNKILLFGLAYLVLVTKPWK